MKKLIFALCVATSMFSYGCGGGMVSPDKAGLPTTESKAGLKKLLEMVATSGTTGSMMGGLKPGIEKVKAADAALGTQLEQDLSELEKATDPAAVKEIATRMAGKL